MTRISKARQIRESSFGFLIQLLGRRIDRDMKERLAEIDVDVKVFSNLMMLSDRDGITQRELGRLLEFPEYFTSRTVDILVENGYVERRPDPNSRRSILVFLTHEGRKKAAELPRVVAGINQSYLSPLDEDERAQLVALLQKVSGIDGNA